MNKNFIGSELNYTGLAVVKIASINFHSLSPVLKKPDPVKGRVQ